MARLIDADALRAQCGPPHWCVWMNEIDDAPTIEVTDFIEYHLDEISRTLHYRVVKDEPVKHGRWEKRKDVIGFVRCSVCHDCNIYDDWADGKKWSYCPNCGAKMMEVDKC